MGSSVLNKKESLQQKYDGLLAKRAGMIEHINTLRRVVDDLQQDYDEVSADCHCLHVTINKL